MNKLISLISIKSRIYLSFIFSSLLLLVISFIAYEGIVNTQDEFKEFDLINSKSQQILTIDLSIANLKNSVEEFSHTGYEAVAEKVNAEMALLRLNLSNNRDTFLDDVKEKEYLNRMVKHLDKYQEIFVLVVEEISQRQKIIDDLYSIEAELLESEKLTDPLKIKLIRLKNILLEYLNDPDILKTNEAIEVLNEQIKVSSGYLRKSLIEYKSNYIGVIQSTRGFLYLTSVVMPAEIQQLEYLSYQLTDLILSKNEPIKSNYRKVITETRDRIIVISVILLLLALLISYFISNSISRPLYQLTNTFKRLASDKPISTIPGLELADEIGDMSKSAEIFRLKNEETKRLLIELDNKKVDLEKSENEIKQSLNFNSLIMNNIPDMVFVKDMEFKIIQANDAFLNSYPEDIRERVIGTTTLEEYNREEAERFLENDRRAFDEGYNETEETISFPDGQVRVLFTKKVRFENVNGEKYILGVSRDITERNMFEQKLKLRTKELERSNEELERFAYVASHDLQEPLRMVASYTNLLANRYKDKLDDDANDFINFAVDGAKRMQTLIDDLLTFSRINTSNKEFTMVDTNQIVDDLLKVLGYSIEQVNNVIVTKDKLPMVKGQVPLLNQLFLNLITNAIKYSDPERKNEIHITAKKAGKRWIFSISDTGIGIASEYFEKIFIIFKRLHGRDKYSGTGIGLALCKKIVEKHGGEIWLESVLDQGTTFMFTLLEK